MVFVAESQDVIISRFEAGQTDNVIDMVERPIGVNRKAFTGGTRAEAMELATRWWASQKGLRQVGKWEVSAGHDPAPQHAHQWVVTIIYEEDF